MERYQRPSLNAKQTYHRTYFEAIQLHTGQIQPTGTLLSTATTAFPCNLWAAKTKPISLSTTLQRDVPSSNSSSAPQPGSIQRTNTYLKSLQPLDSGTGQRSISQPFLSSPQQSKALKRKKKSRKITQRRKKRYSKAKVLESTKTKYLQARIQRTEQRCLTDFGFFANPNLSLQKNFDNALKTTPSTLFCQPKNLTFHNLCKESKLPPGSKELLGLNLKVCLASHFIPNNIKSTMLQLARTIRTKFYSKENGSLNNTAYEKQFIKRTLPGILRLLQ